MTGTVSRTRGEALRMVLSCLVRQANSFFVGTTLRSGTLNHFGLHDSCLLFQTHTIADALAVEVQNQEGSRDVFRLALRC